MAFDSPGRRSAMGPGPQRASAPRAAPGRAARVAHKTLPSGVRVVIWRDESAPVVAVRALWRGGLLYEDRARNGITQLLARVITRGCGGMAGDVITGVARRGQGRISGVSGRDSFGLRAEWPKESWQQGLDLVAQCILQPHLDWAEIIAERHQLMDERQARESEVRHAGLRAFATTLYQSHPYRMSPLGELDSVAAIDRRALRAHYARHYPVSGLTLAIVGNVEPAAAMARVEQRLGSIPAPSSSSEPARPTEAFDGRPASSRETYRYIARDRTRVVLGYPGATLRDPDRFALDIAALVLDDRLARALAEGGLGRLGHARSVPGIDPGYVVVDIACQPGEAAAALERARAEIAALASQPISTGELSSARERLVALHRRALASPARVAAALAFYEAHGLGSAHYFGVQEVIARVSPADVQSASARYLAWERVILVTVTPRVGTPEAERRMRGVRKRVPRRSRRSPGGRRAGR